MDDRAARVAEVANRSGVFRTLLLALPVITFVIDTELRLAAVNGSGLAEEESRFIEGEPLVGRSVLAIIDAVPGNPEFESLLRRALAGHRERTTFRSHARVYDTYLEPVRSPDGSVIGIAGIALNVSTEYRARRALEKSEANLARASRIAGLAWWHYDILRDRGSISDDMFLLYKFGEDDHANRLAFLDRVHDDDRKALGRTIYEAQKLGIPCKGLDYRLLQDDGTYMWVHQQVEVVTNDAGEPTALHGTVLDVTARKNLEEHLRRLAHVDVLTGLANRTHLAERLEETVRKSGEQLATALFFIDVDGFKAVNDTYGHFAGDRLLKQIAQRISACVGPGDFVARSGGDEFVVIVSPAGSRNEVALLAERIVEGCAAPYEAENRELFVSTSIGISMAPRDAVTADALLRNADSALYAAKLGGRNTFRFFTHSMHSIAAHQLALENDLRRAIERHELSLVYQPIVSADGRVRTIEALARWQHPTLGSVGPSTFIPIAEQTGMIRKLGAHFAVEACAALRGWREIDPALRLALNISAKQLDRDGLVAMLEHALGLSGLGFDAIDLEVTESVVMQDIVRAAGILTDLQNRGARISIDDFGTGYSSLAWLRDLPIDTIKIDRSFVADIENDPRSLIIVESIVSLGEAMTVDVIAEGVEHVRQIEALRAIGCRFFQGYAFSRPVTAEYVPTLLDPNGPVRRLPLSSAEQSSRQTSPKRARR